MELLKSSNGMGIWKYNKYLLLNTESQKLSETTSIVRFAIIDIKPCKDLRELLRMPTADSMPPLRKEGSGVRWEIWPG